MASMLAMLIQSSALASPLAMKLFDDSRLRTRYGGCGLFGGLGMPKRRAL